MKIKRRGDEPRAFCSKSFDGSYFFAAFFAGFLAGAFFAAGFLAGAFFAQAFLQQHFFAATFFAGAFLTATFLGMRRRSKTVGEVAKGDSGADLKGPRHDV